MILKCLPVITMTWMAAIAAIAVTSLAACPVAAGAEKDRDRPGYDDTPFLPNSPGESTIATGLSRPWSRREVPDFRAKPPRRRRMPSCSSTAVNPARKPGQWQSFDIVFAAPRFDGNKLVRPAYLTVFFNGVLVQDHRPVLGTTAHRTLAVYDVRMSRGPIKLQQHNSAVRFRNIWVRPLKLDD